MGSMHSRTWKSCVVMLALGTALDARGETVVTLTFDDALANQRQVADLLAPWGMKATFFIISGEVGTPGSLSLDDLYALEADGHEVGGHTLHHEKLSELSADLQREEVCADRMRLLSWGLSPTSFAFPFGADDEKARAVVASCGYNGARDVRGLKDTCSSCPSAETIPPQNPHEVRTPETVSRDHSLADLQGFVTSAEKAGGGWVVLVFHHVDASCDKYTYCVAPSLLRELVAWLALRAPLGTHVKTFGEVIGGQLQPAVPVHPEAPTSALKNPSLEEDADGDGIPDCWQLGPGSPGGVHAGRASEAHGGSWAFRLEQSGDSALPPQLAVLRDEGSCGPAIRSELGQRASFWYRASAPLRLMASFRTSQGAWTAWVKGPELAAAEAWTQGAWQLPVPPPEAVGVSVGAALAGSGWALLDDFGVEQYVRPDPGETSSPAPAPPARGDEGEPSAAPSAPAHAPKPANGCGGSMAAMTALVAFAVASRLGTSRPESWMRR